MTFCPSAWIADPLFDDRGAMETMVTLVTHSASELDAFGNNYLSNIALRTANISSFSSRSSSRCLFLLLFANDTIFQRSITSEELGTNGINLLGRSKTMSCTIVCRLGVFQLTTTIPECHEESPFSTGFVFDFGGYLEDHFEIQIGRRGGWWRCRGRGSDVSDTSDIDYRRSRELS